MEQADASILLLQQSNLMIQAAKLVNQVFIRVKIFKHWQRFKVHGMLLARYFGPNKINLLKKKFKFLTEIIRKTISK